jgi:hypothetical protein
LEAALPVYSGQTLHANANGYGLQWSGFGMVRSPTSGITLLDDRPRWVQASNGDKVRHSEPKA